jgi:AraC-like DNA-binding protein
VGIEPEPPKTKTFDGQFDALDLGAAKIGRIIAPGHRARRHLAAMRRVPDDSIFINYCDSSDYEAEDGAAAAVISRRTPHLHDNGVGFTVRFPEDRRMTLLSLRLPRAALGSAASFASFNVALTRSSFGFLIGEQFRLLSQAMCWKETRAAAAIGHSIEALALALAEEATSWRPDFLGPVTSLDHLKDYARARLDDPRLSISSVASAFACTTRTVQNRFEEADETFTSWLRDERLSKARRMLQEPAHALRPVEWIAHACGFATPAYFHRAFKLRFGAPPGAFRKETRLR